MTLEPAGCQLQESVFLYLPLPLCWDYCTLLPCLAFLMCVLSIELNSACFQSKCFLYRAISQPLLFSCFISSICYSNGKRINTATKDFPLSGKNF